MIKNKFFKNFLVVLLLTCCYFLSNKNSLSYPNSALLKGQYELSPKVKNYIHQLQRLEPESIFVIATIDGKNIKYWYAKSPQGNNNLQINKNTLFEIGSITKVFTALLMMILTDQDKISLDDPIKKYIPKSSLIPMADRKDIIIKDLLTHTSGLPNLPDNFAPQNPQDPYKDYTSKLLYDYFNQQSLTYKNKPKYLYSNLGYATLGHISEIASTQTYTQLIRKNIVNRLNMYNTFVDVPASSNNYPLGHSYGYPVPYWNFDVFKGAGAIKSDAQDLVRFILINMGEIDSDIYPLLKKMQAIQYPTDSPITYIGLGWHINTETGNNIIWHNGGTGGFRSFIGFDPIIKKGVVLLTNNAFAIPVIAKLGAHILNEKIPLTPLRPFIDFPENFLTKYTGKYSSIDNTDKNLSLEIVIKNKKLYVNMATPNTSFIIFSESEKLFYYDQDEIIDIEFQFDNNKLVKGLIIKQSSQQIALKKL